MKQGELYGVWRLLRASSNGRELGTGQTHLVVREQDLWEVWPDATYYEGEPGPERRYQFRRGTPARLQMVMPNGRFCYLVARRGDELRMRLGDVFGQFPSSIAGPTGNLYVYERVTGEDATALLQPPPRVSRETASHPKLGELTHDANIDWWQGTARVGDQPTRVCVTVDPDVDQEAAFDSAAMTLDRIDLDAVRAYVADQHLEKFNDNWRGDDEPPIDAATFASRLVLASVIIDIDGSVSVWFDDGAMFGGHSIDVGLDSDLRPTHADIAG